ncbi:UNVERIFIED_CONTAM: hypothetical protein K2H54_040500, partial [Gekko kuhli]
MWTLENPEKSCRKHLTNKGRADDNEVQEILIKRKHACSSQLRANHSFYHIKEDVEGALKQPVWRVPPDRGCLPEHTVVREKPHCVKIFVDVQTKEMANCSKDFRSHLHLIVESGESVACPGKNCYSHFHTSAVKWYKNGKRVKPQQNRLGLKLRHNKILLQPAYGRDSGNYTCDYMLMDNNAWWNMRTIVRVDVTSKDSDSPPIVLDPVGERNLEVDLGQPVELKCQVKFGFHSNASSLVQWYREKELVSKNRYFPNELGDETFIDILRLEEVTEKDLCTVFVCLAKNSVGESVGQFRLKRRKKTVPLLLTLCCAITALFGLFLGGGLAYQHWIEIVLLYRNYLAKDETVG